MKQYIQALEHILEKGKQRDDRTGVGTRGVFGYQMRFDLRNSFPAVTTKRLAWKSVVSELLWFLEGSTDERRLAEIHFGKKREEIFDKKTIWTANANKQGVELGYINNQTQKELGPVYGKQWRSWGKDVGGEDQRKNIESLDSLENLKTRFVKFQAFLSFPFFVFITFLDWDSCVFLQLFTYSLLIHFLRSFGLDYIRYVSFASLFSFY